LAARAEPFRSSVRFGVGAGALGASTGAALLFIRSDSVEILDSEGSDCPDLEAARRDAVAGVRSILSEEVKGGGLAIAERLDIEDGEGRILHSIAFAEALTLPPGWKIERRH
jgi:hypothetical protein